MGTIFDLATRVTSIYGVATFAIVAIFFLYYRSKNRRTPKPVMAIVLVVSLCLVAVAAQIYAREFTIYRVRVIVLSADNVPVENATLTSSMGGEPKRVSGGWEFDVPAASKPTDGRLTIYAELPTAFLKGQAQVDLTSDHNPVVTLQMQSDKSALVRGFVADDTGEHVPAVHVGVVGYPGEAVETDSGGNFVVKAHAAVGQQVELYAEKQGYAPERQWCQAGNTITFVIPRRHR